CTDRGLQTPMRYGPAAGAVTRAAMVPFLSQSVVVTNSQALADRFQSYHARVIPNGLDLRKFERLPTAEEARRLRGLPTDRTLLSYVGKVIPEKRLEWLLDVVRRLPDTDAVVVGGDTEEHDGEREYRQLHANYADVGARTDIVVE